MLDISCQLNELLLFKLLNARYINCSMGIAFKSAFTDTLIHHMPKAKKLNSQHYFQNDSTHIYPSFDYIIINHIQPNDANI